MVVAWFLVRTVADVDSRVYLLWLLAAGALALVAPKSGLVVLIATSVFFEPDSLARTIAPRELIVLPLALGVLVQIAVDRFRWRPGLCDLARAPARRRDGAGRRPHVPGLRAGLPVACRPIVDRQHAGADHHPHRGRVDGTGRGPARARRRGRGGGGGVGRVPDRIRRAGSISNGPFAWVGFWKGFGARLAGTIPSPNALSTQLIVPTMVLLAAVLLARDVRLRVIALVGLVPVLVAQYLTFSRAPFIALYVFVVIVAWRFRRWSGIAVLVGGLVVGRARAAQLPPTTGSQRRRRCSHPAAILVASDEYRFRAWGAALADVQDKPADRAGLSRLQGARRDLRRPGPGLATQRMAQDLRRGGRRSSASWGSRSSW